MFDYSKLRGRIVEKKGTQQELSKEMGISEVSLSNKMKQLTRFSSDDIIKLTMLLDIPKEEIGDYFFTERV